MNAVQQFEISAQQVVENLDKIAADEQQFTIDFCLACERYSWEMEKMISELRAFREWLEG
jgi:hypothetical protein